MSEIINLKAREILDSRGMPTVEVTVTLSSGVTASAAVPSGASTGSHEALELRDHDKSRFGGKGVKNAVRNVNNRILPALKGVDASEQPMIDRIMIELDGTEGKTNLGANAILAVSLAVAKAAAQEARLPLFRYLGGVNAKTLPIPMMNVINGGAHSDAPIAFQEFMIRPTSAQSFHEAMQMGSEVFYSLKKLLHKAGYNTSVGDEGGFAPDFKGGTYEALDFLMQAIETANYSPGNDVKIALDAASSEFYLNGVYDYRKFEGPSGTVRNQDEQVQYLTELIDKYPIDSIEDGMAESDHAGWIRLTQAIGQRCQLVGDDLFVTNVEYLAQGIRERWANAILIKVNQIGTLTETLDAIEMARRAGYGVIISHRSGETEDPFIADLAVAVNAGQIKTGSLSRSERIAKYNQLLRIEEILEGTSTYGTPKL